MKKTALLIDGGWFSKGLGKILKSAQRLAQRYPGRQKRPDRPARRRGTVPHLLLRLRTVRPGSHKSVDGSKKDYKLMPAYAARKQFFFDLGQTGFVALRRGELKARGWEFSDTYRQGLIAGGVPIAPTATDVYPNFEQKGVDMRIGIDVATLSLKKIVDRIILFSGDTDMIPALKLARREGLQVFVVKLDPSAQTQPYRRQRRRSRALPQTLKSASNYALERKCDKRTRSQDSSNRRKRNQAY